MKWMMKSFRKKVRASWAPLMVHIVCGIIGFAICAIALLPNRGNELLKPGALSEILIALGISIIASVIINIVLALKSVNDLNWKAFEQAYYQSITKRDRIRYSQRIELNFNVFQKNNEPFMKLSIRHSFEYSNLTKFKQKYRIMNLFNDYHIPAPFTITDDFKCSLTVGDANVKLKPSISRDGKIMIEPEHSNDASFDLAPSETKHIRYDIESVYSVNDRLIWSFQEISDGAVIAFDVDSMSKSNALKGNYHLTILHPEADDIKNKNIKNKFLEENGSLNFNIKDNNSTNLLINKYNNYEPFEIRIYDIILPYQGFEVKWDFTKTNLLNFS